MTRYVAVRPGESFLQSSKAHAQQRQSPPISSPLKHPPTQSPQTVSPTPTSPTPALTPSPPPAHEDEIVPEKKNSFPPPLTEKPLPLTQKVSQKSPPPSTPAKRKSGGFTKTLLFLLTISLLTFLAFKAYTYWNSLQQKVEKHPLKAQSTTKNKPQALPKIPPAKSTPSKDISPEPPSPAKKLSLLKVAQSFLEANTWQERMKYCRDIDGTLSQKMAQHYSKTPYLPYNKTSINSKAHRIENFTVLYLWDNQELPSDKLILEKTDQGYLVDWESFIVWQEFSWDQIINTRPAKKITIRSRVKRIPNTSSLYPQEKDYLSYQLIHPTQKDITLIGYYKKKDPSDEPSNGLYILPIRCHENPSQENEVLILNFDSKGWIRKTP